MTNSSRVLVSAGLLFTAFALSGGLIRSLAIPTDAETGPAAGGDLIRSTQSARSDAPVADPELERRLTERKTYRVRRGDTLSRAAHFLYGHTTWWTKLRDANPALSNHGPNDLLPPGAKLRYMGPKVGAHYVVKSNDWLIRIAEWKYGSSDRWVALYRKNADRIKNPNLIHPGDRLVLGNGGTVTNEKTGQVILSGLTGDEESSAAANAGALPGADELAGAEAMSGAEALSDSASMLDRAAAADTRDPASNATVPFWSPRSSFFHYFLGFVTGLALLMLAIAKWGVERFRAQAVVEGRDAKDEPAPCSPAPVRGPSPCASGDTAQFGRRHYSKSSIFDTNRLPEEDGDLDLRPNYHSLVPRKPWKKYLNFQRKKRHS